MTETSSKTAVVTGASSGIGAALVRKLTADGWKVFAAARREDKLNALAEQTGATPVVVDITNDDDVARLRDTVLAEGPLDALVNNAGGAVGTDSVADGSVEDWRFMLELNVLGTLAVTKAFLPALRESQGDILLLSSTAGLVAYEGGGGYVAAKHAEHSISGTLRLEEAEHKVRVIDIAPGMVKTDEFTLNRVGGDAAKAEKVYAGVDEPLTAEDVAEVMAFSLNLPHHINLDQVIMRPVAQAAQHKVIRRG